LTSIAKLSCLIQPLIFFLFGACLEHRYLPQNPCKNNSYFFSDELRKYVLGWPVYMKQIPPAWVNPAVKIKSPDDTELHFFPRMSGSSSLASLVSCHNSSILACLWTFASALILNQKMKEKGFCFNQSQFRFDDLVWNVCFMWLTTRSRKP
jgi:hypothetical protein